MSAVAPPFGLHLVRAALALAALGATGSAWANAGVLILKNFGPDVNDYSDVSVSHSVDYSSALADNLAQGAAALDTGTLKAAATFQLFDTYYWLNGTRRPEVLSLIQDTVTFSGPGPKVAVTLAMHFDGSFNMTGASGLGDIQISPFIELQGYGALSAGVDRLYNPSGISNGGVAQDLVSSEFVGTPAAGSFLNASLTVVEGQLVMTTLVPTNTPISLNVQFDLAFTQLTPGVRAQADFGHTATLSMALPAGYSFTSASGLLLTAAPVPEPSTLGLTAMGLVALQLRRRRTRRAQMA
jgi:hypothetical protein